MSSKKNREWLKLTTGLTIWLAAILIAACRDRDEEAKPAEPTPYNWTKPPHFPEPKYDFSRNPLTNEGVALGRFLFYDGITSRTNLIGCGTCHQPQAAFTHHGHELSHGVDDLLGTRNSPAVQNMAWNSSFFWDGGVHDLDLVPLNPIQNPVELDETVPSIIAKLKAGPRAGAKMPVDYPKLFKAAFGTEEITTERMMKALSQFMLTMVSANSKYDYYLKGDQTALNSVEKQGLALFEKNCTSCHSGVLTSDGSFRNNGLVPTRINDQGRYAITGNDSDKYKFKVPALRNVGVTAPYMHDGRYHSLLEVLDHYSDSVKSLSSASPGAYATLDPALKDGIKLTPGEKLAIIAFLNALTDDIFLKDERLTDPGIGNAL